MEACCTFHPARQHRGRLNKKLKTKSKIVRLSATFICNLRFIVIEAFRLQVSYQILKIEGIITLSTEIIGY
jgi:hypothetical protein